AACRAALATRRAPAGAAGDRVSSFRGLPVQSWRLAWRTSGVLDSHASPLTRRGPAPSVPSAGMPESGVEDLARRGHDHTAVVYRGGTCRDGAAGPNGDATTHKP